MSPHRAVFVEFVRRQRWTRGAELGVDKGILFRQLLDGVPDLHLTGVDVFPLPDRKARVYEIAASCPDRCRVICATTHDASAAIHDGSLDFVFIDADHSYAAVKDDITCWAPKVRAGGWLGGHDYHPRKFPGVVTAVDEAFGRTAHHLDGTIWGVWR